MKPIAIIAIALIALTTVTRAQDDATGDLAAAAQNPLASMISLPFQYFVNHNLDDGWYLVSAPIMTANWNADSSDRWTIPLGGGAGKIMRWGKLPVNLNAQLYYNIEKPEDTGDYTARVQLQFMFPK